MIDHSSAQLGVSLLPLKAVVCCGTTSTTPCHLSTDPVPAPKLAGHKPVRARLGVMSLHVTERHTQTTAVSTQNVRTRTLALLVLI